MDPYQETQATYDYLTTELDRLGLLYLHLVEPAAREHEEGRQLLKKIRTNFSNFLIVNGGYTSRQSAKVVEDGSADMVAFGRPFIRSEAHTSDVQSLMRISYAVYCSKKK